MRKTLKTMAILMIATTLMMTMFAACGNNEVPTNAIVEPTPTIEPTEAPSDVEAPTDEPLDDGIVDEGTIDVDVEDVEGEGEFTLGDWDKYGTRTDYTIMFPDYGYTSEAWTQEHRFENPNYSFYITYFKNANGDEMGFTWVGPVGIGETWGMSNDERTFSVANDNHRLHMWNYGPMSSEDELMRNYDPDTIMGVISSTPIKETFQVEDGEDSYRITFKISETINGKNYIGYACFVDYFDVMECWQFKYLVEESIFDESEALAVVNSIERANVDDFDIVVE